jgi:protein ImuB
MFAVIHIPRFSLQSVLRHEPELIPKPVVLTDPALTKPCITQLTPTARACGICAGMTPSQAMARFGNLVVKTRSLPQEQAAMETLMQTAYAFSPHIEPTAPGVCTIELKGLGMVGRASPRATQLLQQWAAEILRVLKQFHLYGQIGFAETPALALLAAHAAEPILIAEQGKARCPHRAAQDDKTVFVAQSSLQSQRDCALHPRVGELASLPWAGGRTTPNPEGVPPLTLNTPAHGITPQNDFISTLPIEALDLPFESLEILKRWGINTAGAFLALGKDQLAERLGPAIVEIFARLSSHSLRPLKIASPPETFSEEVEFENEIETLEPLLFILRRFIEQLSRRIELLYLVVAELCLKLGLTSGATYERTFTIPSPTGNAETLFRVLHTHLETVRTDAPIATLRLSAKPGRSESHQFGLFETTLRNPNQFAETLARLTALCGSDRVGTPVVEETYRPDTFQMKPPDFRTRAERERSARRPGSQRVPVCKEGGIQRYAPAVSQRLRVGTSRAPVTVSKCVPRGLPMRRFRPPLPARVEICQHRPLRMRSTVFNGVIADVRGPFFSSGNWWENNRWWREEWDIQTADGTLYRIFRAAEEVGETVGRVSCPERAAPVRVAPRAGEAGSQVAPVRATLAPLSLTPCFSEVHERPGDNINCFNSFPVDSESPQRSRMSAAPVTVSNQFERCVPPLPKGEGWGEGEGTGRYPHASELTNCIQPSTVHGEGEERVPLHRCGFEFFVEGVYD